MLKNQKNQKNSGAKRIKNKNRQQYFKIKNTLTIK